MQEIISNLNDLRSQGEVGAVLLGTAYVEHGLEVRLLAQFSKINSEERKRLFDNSAGGILGSLNAKIRIAYAIGLIGSETQNNLLINDIRNVFAHSLHKVSFKNENIVKDCERLKASLDKVDIIDIDGKKFAVTNPLSVFLMVCSLTYFALQQNGEMNKPSEPDTP